MTTFPEAMSKLAASIAKKAELPDTPLPDSTDAFKALVPYFAILYKQSKNDGASTEASFEDFKAEIIEMEKPNGSAPVPGSRRTGYRSTGC